MVPALIRFESLVQLRRPSFWLACVLLVVPTIIFLLVERGRYITAMLGYAYFASLSLRLTIGLAEDRQVGHDLLMSNFATQPQRLAAKFTAFLVRELLFFILTAILATVAWGNLRMGLWYAVLFSLFAFILLPLAIAVEYVTNVRIPGAVALIITFAVLLASFQGSDPKTVFGWIGIPESVGAFSALGPLSLRAAVALALTLALSITRVLASQDARA